MRHPADWIAFLSRVVGLCSIIAGFLSSLPPLPDALLPHFTAWVSYLLIIVGAISTLATDLIRFSRNPTPPTGTQPVLQASPPAPAKDSPA